MEWTNFYGRKFELFCRKTQFVNVQCQIKGLSNDTTQMHITEVTPCSVLITMAANSFNVPESCGKLVIVFKHIKNKSESFIQYYLNDKNVVKAITIFSYQKVQCYMRARYSYDQPYCMYVATKYLYNFNILIIGVCSIRVFEHTSEHLISPKNSEVLLYFYYLFIARVSFKQPLRQTLGLDNQ